MRDPASLLREYMRRRGLTQAQLSEKSKVSQATVSRALRGEPQRKGAARSRLFNFVEIDEYAIQRCQTEAHARVLGAIERVWDRSEAHLDAIIRVIDALSGLGPRSQNRKKGLDGVAK